MILSSSEPNTYKKIKTRPSPVNADHICTLKYPSTPRVKLKGLKKGKPEITTSCSHAFLTQNHEIWEKQGSYYSQAFLHSIRYSMNLVELFSTASLFFVLKDSKALASRPSSQMAMEVINLSCMMRYISKCGD